MDIYRIVKDGNSLLEKNILDPQSRAFLKKYAEAKAIELPIINDYNRSLAKTKSKDEVIKNQSTILSVGILLIIISLILAFLGSSIENPSIKKKLYTASTPSLLLGSVLSLSPLVLKSKYDDSKKATTAREAKIQNELNVKQFYGNCISSLQKEYEKHINFLITDTNKESIAQYKEVECKNEVEKEIFKQLETNYYSNLLKTEIDIKKQQESLKSNLPCIQNSIGCIVKIENNYIIISKGSVFKFLNFFDTDANDVKIPLETITVINYKPSGILDGYLEFVYQGFIPRNNDTVKHAQENVITFRGDIENQLFKDFKELTEIKIREIKNKPVASSNLSIADELSKLAELKNSGILTEEEFQIQKQKIINS